MNYVFDLCIFLTSLSWESSLLNAIHFENIRQTTLMIIKGRDMRFIYG